MLIYLPVKEKGKIIFKTFTLEETDNFFIIDLDSNHLKFIDIIYTNSYGIQTFPIYFPLKFLKFNNILLNEYFFIIPFFNNEIHKELNFFYKVLEYIKKIKRDYTFINLENFDLKNLNLITDIINKTFIFNIVDDSCNNFIKGIYNKYQFYLNICLLIFFINKKDNNTKFSKRINLCMEIIKKKKINFYGNNNTFKFHIENIDKIFVENELLNEHIFLENKLSKKNFKKFVIKIKNNNIYTNERTFNLKKYNLYYYKKKFKNEININNLIQILLNDNFFENVFNIIFKNTRDKLVLKKFFITKNYDDLILIEKINNENIFLKNLLEDNICSENISFTKFKEIYDLKYKKKYFIVLNQLVSIYKYPLTFNKEEFSLTFKKILYILKKNNYDFISKKYLVNKIFNFRIKNLFLFLITFYYCFDNSKVNILNYEKIFNNNLYYSLIYIHLFIDNDILEKNNMYNLLIKNFTLNYKLFQIFNLLCWDNLKYKIKYFSFLLKNKNVIYNFLNYKNNKFISKLINYKILNIINNPFNMCKFLILKEDFIFWTKTFKNYIKYIQFNKIKIKNLDLTNVGLTLYYISSIENQNNNSKSYLLILKNLYEFRNILFYKLKINIDITSIFNNNLNINKLEKDILNIKNYVYIINDLDKSKLQLELEYQKDKHQKYKKKYLSLKKQKN